MMTFKSLGKVIVLLIVFHLFIAYDMATGPTETFTEAAVDTLLYIAAWLIVLVLKLYAEKE
jgi:hypothetical protein